MGGLPVFSGSCVFGFSAGRFQAVPGFAFDTGGFGLLNQGCVQAPDSWTRHGVLFSRPGRSLKALAARAGQNRVDRWVLLRHNECVRDEKRVIALSPAAVGVSSGAPGWSHGRCRDRLVGDGALSPGVHGVAACVAQMVDVLCNADQHRMDGAGIEHDLRGYA